MQVRLTGFFGHVSTPNTNVVLMVLVIGAKINFKYRLDKNSLVSRVYIDAMFYFAINFRALLPKLAFDQGSH